MSALDYMEKAEEILEKVKKTQLENIQKAAELGADSIANGGLLHTFGTGHSHLVAADIYLRAGGLLPVQAILEPSLMLHEQPFKSGELERLPGLAERFLPHHPLSSGDTLIIISNSGRNAVPIETALLGKEMGLKIVAVTSLQHSKSVSSRHPGGENLYQLADVVIDNCAPAGDAILETENAPVPYGAISGITGPFILQALTSEIVKLLSSRGIEPPVIASGNLDWGPKHNEKLIRKYQNLLPWLQRYQGVRRS